MEFPITELLDTKACEEWVIAHLHPTGFRCPKCGAEREQAHPFRVTRRSQLQTYRCNECGQTYNLYSGTIFEQRHLTLRQVVLLLRGFVKGEPSTTLAAELAIHYSTVLALRHDFQDNARRHQPNTALTDHHSETDEMFQNAGEKRNRSHQLG
jgi:transposase-like protein